MESIPAAFVLSKAKLSLGELEWGFELGILGSQSVKEIASAMLDDGIDIDEIVQLAGLARSELADVRPILEGHLQGEDLPRLKAKWLWLLLGWLYEHHGGDEDVFDTIDRIYADFDYPEEMVPFGPYAPAYEGHPPAARARAEVLRHWREYLERGRELFDGSSRPGG